MYLANPTFPSLKRAFPFATKGPTEKKARLDNATQFTTQLLDLIYQNIKNQHDPSILLAGKQHMELACNSLPDLNRSPTYQKKIFFISQLLKYPKLTIKTADLNSTTVDTALLAWHSRFIKKALVQHVRDDFIIEIGKQTDDQQFKKEDIDEACHFFENIETAELSTERLLILLHLSNYLIAPTLSQACVDQLMDVFQDRSFMDESDATSMLEILNIQHPKYMELRKLIMRQISNFVLEAFKKQEFEIFIERKTLIEKSLQSTALSLNFKHSQISNEQLLHLCTLKIAQLKLDDCNHLSGACLQIIKKMHDFSAVHFEKLSLKRCCFVNIESFRYMAYLHHLRTLDLSGCYRITDEVLHYLPTNLVKLSLNSQSFISNVACHYFGLLPNLRHLELRACPLITNGGIEALPLNLESLFLDENKNINKIACQHIEKMNALKILSLTKCRGINDQAVFHLPLDLHVLWLNENKKITNQVFEHIKRMSELTELYLQNNKHMTNSAIRQLAHDLPDCDVFYEYQSD